MKIDRSKLLEDLKKFSQADSGVVIGMPGAGKSYILRQLVIQWSDLKIPSCMLQLDALTNGSDEDIANFFGMPDKNWVKHLSELILPECTKGLIVFDAFDSLRDDQLRNTILKQIATVKRDLPEWSIIVSVRTYDALKSQRLIDLFPLEYHEDEIHCRKFTVPYLTEIELEEVLSSNKLLNSLFLSATARLKEIFRIPFFLSLLNVILKTVPKEVNALSLIKSEIELLDMYWSKVVYRIQPKLKTEKLLRKLTQQMISTRQLSVDKFEYLDKLENDEILIVDSLLSENVLAEQGIRLTKIAYAHNILFDYAVSRLILKESAQEIANFIQEDPSRCLFLRPSFIYFFTNLWYKARDIFWKIYNELSSNPANDLTIFNKLIPPAVIVREFEDTSELPWFHGDGASYYVDQIKDTLQGFKFLEIKADELTQAKLLHSISSKLDMRFIGDFAMELRRQLSDENRRGQSEVFKLLGKSARNLFDFAMLYKEDPAYNLEMIIAYHGITNIAVTYCSDIDESKKRLKHVLTLINTSDFPIRFVSSILEELKCINACDTEFVAEIYKTVFSHVENERTQTEIGRSFMMKFMTNRVDDYELCKFRLKEFFPIFLRENSALAIKVSLELISIYIERKYQGGILIKDHIKIPEHFNINGVESDYFPDMSHFWGQYLDNVKEIEILEHVFEYFDILLAERKYNALKEHLQAYLKAAHYALTWKLLLEWAAGHPEELHAILFELLLSPAIFYWNDTAEATTIFLSAALPFYVPEQINKIELAVRSIREFVSGEDHLNAERKAQQFLSFISSLKSRTIESKNVSVENHEVELQQEFKDSYVHSKHPRTLAEKKVTEISDSQYNTVGDNISRLTEFARMHENIPPDFETLSQILNISKTIFPETEKGKNKDSALALITTLSSVFIIGMKSALDNRGSDLKIPIDYALVKLVLTDATAVHTAFDEYAEKNYNLSSPYTNTAKSEAAGGVIFLYKLTGDSQLLPLIEKLSSDKSPIVRFRLINQIGLLYNDQADLFWKVILERLRNEKDLSILGMIVTKLERRNIIDNERSKFIDALRLSAVRQPSDVETNKNFYEPFLVVCLVGFRLTNDSSIEEIIDNFIKDNFDGTPLMIYHIFKIVEPGNFRRDYEHAEDLKSSQYLLQIVVNLVKQCGGKLLAVKNLPEVTQEGITSFLILDEVIKRVYFSLQVNERLKKMNRDRRSASKKEQQIFYYLVKPILKEFLNLSLELSYVQPTTAHSFIQILTLALDYDPEFSIFNIRKITEMAMMSGYLGDRSSIEEAIKFANKLLTDHRDLLTDQNAFVELSKLLEIYVKAGWPEALELLWKFDEIFK